MNLRRERDAAEVLLIAETSDQALRGAGLDLGFHERGGELVRSFPVESPALDRFVEHAEELFLQAAGIRPVPWREALRDLLARLEGAGLDWWLTGSGALAVRGVPVEPRDLDLVVDLDGSRRLGELLEDVLVEPTVISSGWIADAFGRAFLHARVEWVGGVHPDVDEHGPCDFGPTAAARLDTVVWHGHEIRVPPLELQIAVAERRGLAERAAAARSVV